MLRITLSLLVAATLALAAPATAQDHEHDMSDGMLLIMSDLPEDGRAVVGEIAHFQYVLLDKDGAPFPHHDMHVLIHLNGIPLYQTLDAHDYDGIGGVDVVFPASGHYNVTVTVPIEGRSLNATYSGYVVPAEGAQSAKVLLDAPTTATAGAPVTFTYAVVGANDTLIPHSDALVQVRRTQDDFVVLDVHTHSHESDMTFDYAFEKAGTYDVRIIGYMAFPDASAAVFTPVVHHHTITVSGAQPPTAKAPSPPGIIETEIAMPEPEESPYTTHIAADPVSGTERIAGPFSQVRTSHVTYDTASMALVAHLDHEATLRGPHGIVFTSKSLHEYDGVLTLLAANQALGDYTWTITVKRGDWKETKSYAYEIAAASLPRQVGPQFIDVTGTDKLTAATPGPVGFFVHGAGDAPFRHSEVGFEIQDATGLPILAHKLHTHATGTFAFEVAMPLAGPHTLRVDPFDVHGSPTPVYYGKDATSPRAVAFQALEGTWPTENVTEGPTVVDEEEAVPGPAATTLLAVLAIGLFALRRRR